MKKKQKTLLLRFDRILSQDLLRQVIILVAILLVIFQRKGNFVLNEKKIAKSGDYLIFFVYLCHVIDEFQLP